MGFIEIDIDHGQKTSPNVWMIEIASTLFRVLSSIKRYVRNVFKRKA